MPVKQYHYEQLLAEYSNCENAILLLKQYRPYLEMMPSMRRPQESLITIPLPNIRIREPVSPSSPTGLTASQGEVIGLPCEIAILMCDPEWKVKMGEEIFVFIHRPDEDFSSLLRRWRQTQLWLSHGYEWIMPLHYQYIIGEGSDSIYPLFIIFEETPERIRRGLTGAALPFLVQKTVSVPEEDPQESSEEILSSPE